MLDRWLSKAHGPDDPSVRPRQVAATAGDDITDLARRLSHSFAGRCLRRFVDMAGIDRSMVLASQAFTALVPLLILIATWAPAGRSNLVASSIIRKFSLEGSAASAVTQLFAVPEGAGTSVSAFSAVLLLISGTSFTRRLQRMYRAAYARADATGIRNGVYSTLGLFALLVELSVLYAARALVAFLPFSWALTLPIAILTGAVLWTSIPYLLLNREVHWRRLVFGGIVAAVATSIYALVTTLYMPQQVERYASQFGLFGVTLAMIGWLLATALLLVASAAVGAEFDAARAPWALWTKTALRLRQPGVDQPQPPAEDLSAGLTEADIRLIVRVLSSWGILAAAVWTATLVVPGIAVPGGLAAHLGVSLLLGLVSALLGAVPRVLPVPRSAMVVAAASLVVNALLLVVVATLTPGLEVSNGRAAVLGGLVIAVVTTVLEVVWRPIKQFL